MNDQITPEELEIDSDSKRKQEEADFHSSRECDRLKMSREEFEAKYKNKTFYSVCRKTDRSIARWMEANCPGAKALDFCCGLGQVSVQLAQHGAQVTGIDIAPDEIETARRRAADMGLSEKTEFHVMDAENTSFPDDTFDVIICSGVLHHLDITKAYTELHRILKPTGKILAHESLGHNPIIQAYRRATPKIRTAWETDHILSTKELRLARNYFDGISVRYYYLFSILAIPLRSTIFFKPALAVAEGLDAILLSIPLVRLMAWQMIFELSRPRRD